MVDGGDNSDLAVANLESVLPPLDRRIDVLLSTHPDADHLGGLQQIVERFDVDVIVECSNFNDDGVVARLEFRDVSVLQTGDATSAAETDLLLTGQPLKSTVLKVGHHGSRTSTTQRFLDAVDPVVAIVTTGIKNQFGHPHEDVIDRLESSLSQEAVFVTRNRGTISVITDGDRVWVESARSLVPVPQLLLH